MIDPWQNDDSGFWGTWYHRIFPKTYADIAISTHDHFDHNALDRVLAPMKLDRMVGRYEFGDVIIEGISEKHTVRGSTGELFEELGLEKNPPNNPPQLDNTMFLITSGGVRILFWGDNRFDLPASVENRLKGKVDVIVIPIDGSQHLLTYQEIDSLVDSLGVKVIVPCHYLTKGVGSTLSTLQTAEGFVEIQREKNTLVELESHTHTFSPGQIKELAKDGTATTYYYGHNLPFAPADLEESRLYCKAVATYGPKE